MLRSISTSVLTASACVLAFAGLAAAQTAPAKIAVVNIQEAILQTDEIRRVSSQLETKYKPRQAEVQKVQQELDGIQQKLQAGQGKLSPQQEADLNALGQRRQRELQRLSQDLQEEFEAERNEILTGAGRRVRAVITKLAEARGFDLVVDMNSTLFVRPAVDITKDVTAEYNKAHPVAGAAPAAAPPAAPPKP